MVYYVNVKRMKSIFKIVSIASLFASTILLSGCGAALVTTQPQAPVVVIPASPGPDYVWVNGSWRYNRPVRAYEFREGYWVKPRKAGRTWVEGRWVNTRKGWKYVKGYWR